MVDKIDIYPQTSCSCRLNIDRNSFHFMYSGKIGELVQNLAGKEIKDLIIEEPALEEIFMHYYSEEEKNKKAC